MVASKVPNNNVGKNVDMWKLFMATLETKHPLLLVYLPKTNNILKNNNYQKFPPIEMNYQLESCTKNDSDKREFFRLSGRKYQRDKFLKPEQKRK